MFTHKTDRARYIQELQMVSYWAWSQIQRIMTSNCEIPMQSPCPICLANLDDGEETYVYYKTCRLLKCNHRFHIDCIKAWFKYDRPHCPYCRSQVVCVKLEATNGPTQLYWDCVSDFCVISAFSSRGQSRRGEGNLMYMFISASKDSF